MKQVLALIDLGVRPEYSIEKNKRIRMINIYTYVAVGNAIPLAILGWLIGVTAITYVMVTFSALSSLMWVANIYGKNRYSKGCIVILMYSVAFFMNAVIPKETFFSDYIYSITLVPFLLYRREERRSLALSMLLALTTFCVIHSDLEALSFMQTDLFDKLGILFPFKMFTIICSLTTVIAIVYGFYYAMSLAEEQLTEQKEMIATQAQNIKNILENLTQGLFTFNGSYTINPDYSTYLKTIFHRDTISGCDVDDFLFADSNINKDTRNQIRSVFASAIGEVEIAFAANEAILPREITKVIHGQNRILEIDWQPFIIAGIIEKFLVVVRDVTDLRILAQKNREKEMKLEVLDLVMMGKAANAARTLDETETTLKDLKNSFKKSMVDDSLKKALRALHTAKGNARVYNFSYASETLHSAEEYFQSLLGHTEEKDALKDLDKKFSEVESCVGRYKQIIQGNINKTSVSTDDKTQVFLKIERMLMNQPQKTLEEKARIMDDVVHLIYESHFVKLAEILEHEISSLSDIAAQEALPIPSVHIDDKGLTINNESTDFLKNIFGHLLRNSLTHGIEKPIIREQKNKSMHAHIHVVMYSADANSVALEYWDDGQGLNLHRLAEKAKEKGLPTPNNDEECAKLIYESGLSTAVKVTHIAGRGVGMDAVKSLIEERGGTIAIEFTGAKEASGHRPFRFRIRLPLSYHKSRLAA